MNPEVLSQLPSLGISGLLFVMWWLERQERTRGTAGLRDALQYAGQVSDVNRSLLEAIRANTEALAGLREALQTHRTCETEWMERLAHQLDELGCT
jgi:hypothetical protein